MNFVPLMWCPDFEDWQERAFTVGIGGPVGSGKILGAWRFSEVTGISPTWHSPGIISGLQASERSDLSMEYRFFLVGSYLFQIGFFSWDAHPRSKTKGLFEDA